jgi:hypothetical protein
VASSSSLAPVFRARARLRGRFEELLGGADTGYAKEKEKLKREFELSLSENGR